MIKKFLNNDKMSQARRVEIAFEVVRVIVAILLAYALALALLLIFSDDPAGTVRQFIIGPFTNLRRVGNIIEQAIPLMFTGLCMCFMYSVNEFNLAGEGAFIMGGCITSWIALSIPGGIIPSFLMIILLFLIAGMVGVAVASVPAVLKAKLNVNEIVSSLMMNKIMYYLSSFILFYYMRDTTIAMGGSWRLPNELKLPILIPRTNVHLGLILALIAVAVTVVVFYRTPFGGAIRIVGSNRFFAEYTGINVNKNLIAAQIVGGFLAGLGGCIEIFGMYTRYQWIIAAPTAGMDGILVAVLARRKPALIPVTALLLAYIRTGADVVNLSTEVPAEFIQVIQAIVILLVAAQMFLAKTRNKIIYKQAQDDLAKEEQPA